MDLKQRKLTKSEWDSIEIPVSASENEVLQLIVKGYSDVNIRINKTNSIFTYLKIDYTPQLEEYLYKKYFDNRVKKLIELYNIDYIIFRAKPKKLQNNSNDENCYIDINSNVSLKSSDKIRLSRHDNIDENIDVYELVLFKIVEELFLLKEGVKKDNKIIKKDKKVQDIKKDIKQTQKWMSCYYTLNNLIKNNIDKINIYVKQIVQTILNNLESDVDLLHIISNSNEYIEKNPNLLKYGDMCLYTHQKQIFNALSVKTEEQDPEFIPKPKLILYIAPTGTGKTLTPIGLSENHKVIFVCAARHVGLALAKSAISVNKRVAFAFGCSGSDDVRLHYFSAKEYTKHKRSGAIRKVDNTVGDKVEIIICDIRSYIPAMFYMLSFNEAHKIVTYWDEPTITLDYEDHDLHKIIKKNWSENLIPNFVLSSATLPKLHELTLPIADFQERFPNSEIINIVSHDCRKTIPLINNNGYVIMPHYLSKEYAEILQIVEHCEDNLTLLRYFDLKESSEFIRFVQENEYGHSKARLDRNFASCDDIDMQSIKIYYLKVLKSIIPGVWETIYEHFNNVRVKRINHNSSVDTKGNKSIRKISSVGPGVGKSDNTTDGKSIYRTVSEQILPSNKTPSTLESRLDSRLDSGLGSRLEPNGSCAIYVTTKDAYTLTDGPTIFLAGDVQKVAKFSIQQANIPSTVMKDIVEKIEFNNVVNKRIDELDAIIEEEKEKYANKLGECTGSDKKETKKKDRIAEKKMDRKLDNNDDKNVTKMKEELIMLRGMIKTATLNDLFIPNKLSHLNKWAEDKQNFNSFTSDVDDEIIATIMMLKNVEDSWKILLLMGIGVFTQHESIAYTEIMKKLADTQKLYLIIADSDYIYGTNYQFCHGYLSKDLRLTQEKIIQALGRVGRNNIQQEYSVRFRDDDQIKMLFTKFDSNSKPEVRNMNILFNSKNVVWDGENYEIMNENNVNI
jgi:hypothetical protein